MNEENVAIVFHGFLNLTNLEKLKLTEKINEFLDSTSREPLRAEAEESFRRIAPDKTCKCCGNEIGTKS